MNSNFIKLLIPFCFVILLSMTSCVAQSKTAKDEKLSTCKSMTLAEAEKILGQSSKFVEANTEDKDGSHVLKCKYTAISPDKNTGREISLYFMLEESSNDEQAKQIYKDIWDSNKNHAGIELMNGVGDEAYSHSESPNFHFVLARKGKFTVRIKVNKAVENTSLAEVKNFAKKLIGQI